MPEALTFSPELFALVFAVILAVWAMMRGVFRLLRWMVSLGVGLACGAWVWLDGERWIGHVVDRPSDRVIGLASVAALVLGTVLAGEVWKRLAGGKSEASASDGTSKVVSALLSLLPAAFFLWAIGIAIRLCGSVSSLAWTDESTDAPPPWLTRLVTMISSGPIGRVFEATDPFVNQSALRLCEVLVAYRVPEHVVRLERRDGYSRLLSHPHFQRLLNDREVKRAIAFGDHARLLTLPEVKAAARDPEILDALAELPEPEVRRAVRVE